MERSCISPVAHSSGLVPFTSEIVGSNLDFDSLFHVRSQRSWVFSGYSGFLLLEIVEAEVEELFAFG